MIKKLSVETIIEAIESSSVGQRHNVDVIKRGEQYVCRFPALDDEQKPVEPYGVNALAKELYPLLGTVLIPQLFSDGKTLWNEVIIVTSPLSEDDFVAHGYEVTLFAHNGMFAERVRANGFHPALGKNIICVDGEPIGILSGFDSRISGMWLSELVKWHKTGIKIGRAKSPSAISPILREELRKEKSFGRSRIKKDVKVTPHTIRKRLDQHSEYRAKRNVEVVQRGNQIVCRIFCGWNDRKAESQASMLANTVYNLTNIQTIPSVREDDRRYWAEAILVTSPMSVDDFEQHEFTVDRVEGTDVFFYHDTIEKRWVFRTGVVEIGRTECYCPRNVLPILLYRLMSGVKIGRDQEHGSDDGEKTYLEMIGVLPQSNIRTIMDRLNHQTTNLF